MEKMNKRGQDLSIGTLILIVLGIIVLVLLILGFSLGWSNLWEKINIFKGGSSIGDIANACKIAVASQDVYSYCQDFKKIKINGQTEYLNCLDGRVQSSLESERITCPDGYTTDEISAKSYCIGQTKSTTKQGNVKINGKLYDSSNCNKIG